VKWQDAQLLQEEDKSPFRWLLEIFSQDQPTSTKGTFTTLSTSKGRNAPKTNGLLVWGTTMNSMNSTSNFLLQGDGGPLSFLRKWQGNRRVRTTGRQGQCALPENTEKERFPRSTTVNGEQGFEPFYNGGCDRGDLEHENGPVPLPERT